MKILIKFFLISFLVVIFQTKSLSQEKVVYVDVDKIMVDSKVGKSIKKQLDKLAKDNIDKFSKMEAELKSEEKKIISKKNVLSQEEFQKQLNSLREKASNYRKTRNENINSLTNKRIDATAKILSALNPILAKYSEENGIAIIIQKKNIIIGKSSLDITSDILKIVDNEIKSFKIK